MLPFISETDDSRAVAGGQNIVAVPPSYRFLPLRGVPQDVRVRSRIYQPAKGKTAAQRAGLRYEDKIQRLLSQEFHGYIPGPHIHFRDGPEGDAFWRTVIPDGILVRPWGVFLFEIKISHMAEAWWQLSELYKPVLSKFYNSPISLLEITKTYDPSTPFPCRHTMVDSLHSWTSESRPEFGVYVWRI